MAIGVKELLGSAFLLVLSIMCTVFACTIVHGHKNAIVLLPLMFYIFGPLPMLLCGVKPQSDSFMGDNDASSTFTNIGHWLTGAFGVSGPCCALILYHTAQINQAALFLSLGSAILLIAAAGLLVHGMMAESQDDLGF